MKCDEFRNKADGMMDLVRGLALSDLSAEMRAHLEICAGCRQYFESAGRADNVLRRESPVMISPDLYDKLLRIEVESRVKEPIVPVKSMIVYVSKIFLPAIALWIIGMFLPEAGHVATETALLVFAMVTAFEKMGRRIVTDNV